MHISIFCVNYNSYNELQQYIRSIEESVQDLENSIIVDVYIADNTYENIKPINYRSNIINIIPFSFKENLGYLGGVSKMIKKVVYNKITAYNYFIISNVDLLISKSFFADLTNLRIEKNIGWIAPQIHSLSEKRDRNPKILNRPSLKRIQLLLLLFRFPILYNIYNNYIYPRKKKTDRITESESVIYAGHGSLMIFTRQFIVDNYNFNFPSFLFGEELFFAELCRKSKLDVIYYPKIKVTDIDHASTGKLKREKYCRMNYDSLNKLKFLYQDEQN